MEASGVRQRVPHARLAAVTRKMNEIEKLLLSKLNHDIVQKEYSLYMDRLEALYSVCEGSDERIKQWLNNAMGPIAEFKCKVESYLADAYKAKADLIRSSQSSSIKSGSAERASEGSIHSGVTRLSSVSRSSSSSARVRLAEIKAKLVADKEHAEEIFNIEEQEMMLKHMKLKSEIKRNEREHEVLESELNRIDGSENSLCSMLRGMRGRLGAEVVPERQFSSQFSQSDSAQVVHEKRTPANRRGSYNESISSSVRNCSRFGTGLRTPASPVTPPGGETSSVLVDVIRTQNEISLSLRRQQEISSLPRKTLEVFDGSDVTKFKTFIRKFEKIIEVKCRDDWDKFSYLEQHTAGQANKMVQSYSNADPCEAYQRAKRKLTKEYGNEYRVADAFLKVLDQWPLIKGEDACALEDLSLFLNKCKSHLENRSLFNQLNSPKEIMGIVGKLPYRLRERWRDLTFMISGSNRPALFDDLAVFVEGELDVLKQPLYGNLNNELSRKFTNSKRIFVSQQLESADVESCVFCESEGHHTGNCLKLAEETSENKQFFVKKNGLCFSCLNRGHMSRQCSSRLVCATCNKFHPTALHSSRPGGSSEVNTVNFTTGADKSVKCPIVAAKVKFGNRTKIMNVALDNQASGCWINENLARELHMDLQPTTINVTTMFKIGGVMKSYSVHKLMIGGVYNGKWTEIPTLLTKRSEDWPFSKKDLPSEQDIQSYDHLRDVPFGFNRDCDVDLLIGMSMPGLLMPLEVISGEWNMPYACLHWLGWSYNGPASQPSDVVACNKTRVSRSIESDFDRMYSQDFFDPRSGEAQSVEDKLWLSKVESSIRRLSSGHYEIDLPFRNEPTSLPSNKQQALSRFNSLRERFRKNKKLFEDYDLFMRTMIERNFAELVPNSKLGENIGVEWFLVHHSVYHKQKLKIRIVFDCSLQYRGISLNSLLLQGPDLTNNLIGVLLRFRQEATAFTADIEKMFCQVRVPERQANLLKFFWFDDNGAVREYRLRVHLFGATSSPSVANYALRRCAIDYCSDQRTSDSINSNFYVDDLLKSVSREHEAIVLAKNIRATIGMANFNLTSFQSNSATFINDINSRVSSEPCLKIADSGELSRTLGLLWSVEHDVFMFEVCDGDTNMTRRGILRAIASIYDPLGLLAPTILPAKLIFRETCRLKLSWDESLPPHLESAWKTWKENISDVSKYNIPRCLKPKMKIFGGTIELNIFCDGSECGYGAVAYLRFVSEEIFVSSPVFSKSRVTPINNRTLKTIPRIELCAAKLGVELYEILQLQLDYAFASVGFWTDSTVVLSYLQNETKRFQRFVENKVSYIRSRCSPEQWHHVSTSENPADLVSRGVSAFELRSSKLWNSGPEFLRQQGGHLKRKYEILDDDDEVKREARVFSAGVRNSSPTDILLNSASSLWKLKLKVVWILKFIDHLKGKKVERQIEADELRSAEIYIWIYVQSTFLDGAYLEGIKGLKTFVGSDGLRRVGGRLQNSALPFETKHPIVLPGSSQVVRLLVIQSHVAVGHLGREATLAHLRTKYWIIKGTVCIRGVTKDCMVCRKYQGKPSYQTMSDLPLNRVTEGSIFENVGVDYFGPFNVVSGRKSLKRYGVIFTCLTTRAAHLEVSHSLSSDSFIQTLSRFISRRGGVKSLLSDNGTNFVGANRELKEAIRTWNDGNTESWLMKRNIEWKFNPPSSSHYGGVWEREIRTVRKVLDGLMKEQPTKLTDECLLTLLCEVEFILNSRPLTPNSTSADDLEALTPNHLLLQNKSGNLPPTVHYSGTYDRQWKRVQYLASIFWSRWRREYITTLQRRQKWVKGSREIVEGDLVLIVDINLPRNQWALGRVVKMKVSEDGRPRTASIRTSKRKDNAVVNFSTTIIERPITKLIYLRTL